MSWGLRLSFAKNIRAIKLGLALIVGYASPTFAQPLDHIRLQQDGDVVLATIMLTDQVQFLRSFLSGNSRYLEIYFARTPGTSMTDTWVDSDELRSPETSSAPAFTVKTLDPTLKPKLVVEFSREVQVSVSPGPDGRSFVMAIKAAKKEDFSSKVNLPFLPDVAPPLPSSSVAAASSVGGETASSGSNSQAYALMLTGRDALSAKNDLAAVDAFNRLLLLPPNQYSQDAQEWVGVARERAGQIAKAKVEYELYLKLYTTGPGVQRVKQRLTNLASPTSATQTGAASKKSGPQSFSRGSLMSHYYYGQSTIQSTYPFNNTVQTSNFSMKDQSSLISNVDATSRYVNDDYDNRMVFRDMSFQNYVPGQSNKNQVTSAYVEVKSRKDNYSARVGRQSPLGGGVMGWFDGVSAGYGSAQDGRVNVVAGQSVDFMSSILPVFYGISLDEGPMSLYFINQTIEGILDRRAVGAEYRYYEGTRTAYALLDYDIYFNALNTAMVNGTLGVETTGTTFNFIADYQKSPLLSTRNALNGASTTSVQDLLTVMNQDQLHQLAMSRTGSTAYSELGVTQKMNETWQLSGDVKLAKISGLPASDATTLASLGLPATASTVAGILPATPDTGLEKTMTAQVIGSNLYSNADITSLGTSYVASDYIKNGEMIFIYNRTALDSDLSLDSAWNFYSQIDNYGSSTVRNTPTLRLTYRMQQMLSLDAEIGTDITTTTGAYQVSTTTRLFGSFGFRADF